jgi:hypothetical protein
MQIKGFLKILLLTVMLAPLLNCRDGLEEIRGPLKEEAGIIEKNIYRIRETNQRLKEAERADQLQSQLDLRRELDEIILKVNSALRRCSEKYMSGRNIPFRQLSKTGGFEVREVKLIGCRFNEETMDIDVHLMVTAKALGSRNNSLPAGLSNDSGKCLRKINFSLTNDYPENGKDVVLLAHTQNYNSIKNFTKVMFD